MKWLAALALLTGACSVAPEVQGDAVTMPGQETALAIIWQEIGHKPQPIELRWVFPRDWDCGGEEFYTVSGCAQGATSLDRRTVRLIWRGPAMSNVSDLLAHELLCHVTGVDNAHVGECHPDNHDAKFFPIAQAVYDAGL